MNYEEEEYNPFGGFGGGCDLHGEDYLRECTMCGIEFCAACFSRSALCQDCAAQAEFDDDEDEEPTEEEKELRLLDEFNDDELVEEEDGPSPFAPPAPDATRQKAAPGDAGNRKSAARSSKASRGRPAALSASKAKPASVKKKASPKTKPAPAKKKAAPKAKPAKSGGKPAASRKPAKAKASASKARKR